MLSYVIMISFFGGTVTAPFSPLPALSTDRYPIDPISRLPINHVTCLGNPDIQLPTFPGWDPNRGSMQEICVRRSAGGTGAYRRSLGAECNTRAQLGPDNRHPLEFDRWKLLSHYDALYNPRLIQHCQLRCFCSQGVENLAVKPWNLVVQEASGVLPFMYTALRSFTAYQIAIDISDDFSHSTRPYGHACLRTLHALPLLPGRDWLSRLCPDTPKWKQIRNKNRPFISYTQKKNLRPRSRAFGLDRLGSIVFDPMNNITCDNALPPFPLELPDEFLEMDDLQQICAVSLSGGSRITNAGGYCHRVWDDSQPEFGPIERRVVAFSDEMTPRLEWTAAQNFFFATALRFHCRSNCMCQYRTASDPDHPDESNIWEIDESTRLVRGIWGDITLQRTGYPIAQGYPETADGHPADDDGRQGGSGAGTSRSEVVLEILPSQANGPVFGTCGADKKQFCQEPWPEDILGPLPRSPTVYIPGMPRSSFGNVCKTSCTNSQECENQSTASCPVLGQCAVDITTMMEKVVGSLGNVVTSFAISRCMRKHSRLNGRTEENQDMLNWPCACNNTYVSHGCCGVADGLVWEAPHLWLGELKV